MIITLIARVAQVRTFSALQMRATGTPNIDCKL
jgi:hypothetical protein